MPCGWQGPVRRALEHATLKNKLGGALVHPYFNKPDPADSHHVEEIQTGSLDFFYMTQSSD